MLSREIGEKVISHKHKCIFVHIPKCAGTSVEAVLGHHDNFVAGIRQDHRSLAQIQPFSIYHALKLHSLKADIRNLYQITKMVGKQYNPDNFSEIDTSSYDEYYKFSFVRDPWSRAYSWYQNVVRDTEHQKIYHIGLNDFGTFLAKYAGKRALRPQTYWLKDRQGGIDMDFIGQFDNLYEDFNKVLKDLGIAEKNLPWLIKGNNDVEYSKLYTEQMDQIIKSVYAEEIEMFSFVKPK